MNLLDLREPALVAENDDVVTNLLEAALGVEAPVLVLRQLGEAPLVGDKHALAARELAGRALQSLAEDGLSAGAGADGDELLADVDAGSSAARLTPGVSHTGGETIGTSHVHDLVDAEHVERVSADAEVVAGLVDERVEAVAVRGDTSSFQGLGGDLLLLLGDEVDADREVVDRDALATGVVHTDLGVRHGAAVAALGVRLVLLVTVAGSRTAAHFLSIVKLTETYTDLEEARAAGCQ